MFTEKFAMRKLFYSLLTLSIYITSVRFGGCKDSTDDHHGNWYYLDQKPRNSNDNPIENFAIIVGENGSVATSDGRPPAPWIDRQSGVTQNLNALTGLRIPDSTIAYAVGDEGVILRSSNRGVNWSIIRTPNQNQPNLNGVGVEPPGTGFTNIIAVGNSGTVLKSSNNGGSWSWINVSINTTRKLNSVAGSGLLLTVVGDSGAIYRTLDGGANWENRSISSSVSLKKITSISYDRFVAVGTNGSIYRSSDYGYTWGLRSSGTTRTFRDVYFSGIDSGACAGDFGTIRLTTNGGLTWYSDSYLNSLTTRNILSFARVDGNTFNSITTSRTPGDNAVDTTFFLAVSSEPFSGIEPISNLIARVFDLKQNYPDPFNPMTKIRFDVPAGAKYKPIELKVYDVLGKEIVTLVNEQLKAGQYEIEWDAASYPSGVYFYKLSSSEFSETKKMILIK
jgi:photosystem II stability/assembly factor-like uncharacterized protein